MSTPYNSTSNLISYTPSSSASLTSRSSLESSLTSSSSSTSAPRDYSAAFGALSSTYGANGAAPTPIVRRAADGPRSSAPTKKSWKERIFPASCQVAPLPPSTPMRTQRTVARDYEATFGALQADYGLQGMAPQLNRQGQTKSL